MFAKDNINVSHKNKLKNFHTYDLEQTNLIYHARGQYNKFFTAVFFPYCNKLECLQMLVTSTLV